MAHLQYIPGDPRLVDQLVYELKSKGIFDQFRKDCIADVDTRPAYQNLRQRVENSVSTFLAHQAWKPDLNKNQLREKLRKHILDGNYLEQGVERIVDQVVNPKVASVFIPQVEDLVYNYLGITRKKSAPVAETSNGNLTKNDLLPTDLEAVSPGSVKSNDDKNEEMDISQNGEDFKMDVDEKPKDVKDEEDKVKADPQDTQLSGISELTSNDSGSLDKSTIPLPSEEIKLENIPAPENSPPKAAKVKVELENIQLPLEPNLSTDIPLPEEIPKHETEHYFKPVNSDDDDSSSDSSLIRNMSPLTPIRNFNNENSCDAQQAFEDDADSKSDKKDSEPSTFRFTIETKAENSSDAVKNEKKEAEALSYQFNNQVNINTFNTPMYDDSSNSTHLQIDYESDVSKNNSENKIPEPDHNSEDSKKDNKKAEEKKSSHRSSHHRDSHRHSSSKDRRSDSKQSSSKDNKSDRKSSKDDHKSSGKSSSHKDKSSERSDKKDSRESSKHRSSSSHKSSSSHRDSKSHRSSSSSQRHSSSNKHSDEKKSSSSSHKDKSDRSSDKYSKEKSSRDSKPSSSSHRSDKDKKSSSSSSKSKSDDKERQKKDKKETDDHYSASGRGNHSRRSTDRDSNDGSSSSKGSHNQANSKSVEAKKESKGSTSKSDNTSTSGDSASPSDKELLVNEANNKLQSLPPVKPIIRIENHLEVPIASPPRLPFVPDVTLKKPKFAANMQEARKLMKMRKFLDEEQKRMNQEAALLLEFQANVRPSLSQVYSSIPGPELEFACVTSTPRDNVGDEQVPSEAVNGDVADNVESRIDTISDILTAAQQVENTQVDTDRQEVVIETVTESVESVATREIEEEVDGTTNAATVQIDSIIEANNISESIDVDIDRKDDKNIKIDIVPSDDIENKEIVPNGTCENEGVGQIEEVDFNTEEHDDGIEQKLKILMEDGYNTRTEYFQVTIITEELSETEEVDTKPEKDKLKEDICSEESPLEYFAEHEKYSAELERDTFSEFLKSFKDRISTNKLYLVNCDSYEENILKEVSSNFGQFEIVNYYKNGHLKLNSKSRNIVRNVNVESEISLPAKVNTDSKSTLPIFSPVKSECSFELSSDYDAKLEEMVSKTSRKEIMEIILGNVVEMETEASEMPTIDYCHESNIESDTENTMKRKYCEVGSSVNNNRQVLTPNKIRKLSGSDQISSTTEETEETSNNNVVSIPLRSKYLGRAKRVGLSRPRKSNLPNSPSSDKSVENYVENVRAPAQRKQRYERTDLYKPRHARRQPLS